MDTTTNIKHLINENSSTATGAEGAVTAEGSASVPSVDVDVTTVFAADGVAASVSAVASASASAIASAPTVASASAAASALPSPTFTLISSPIGLGPLIPVSHGTRSPVPFASAAASAKSVDAQCLLDGLGLLISFLLDEEMNYLCGVPNRMRSAHRLNFRGGYRHRKLRTGLGTIPLRVPFLRYLHPRVSIVKRARRLSSDVFAQLVCVHASGVTPDNAAALVKTLWTVTLPDELLATLAGKLTPILDAWRASASAAAAMTQPKTPMDCAMI